MKNLSSSGHQNDDPEVLQTHIKGFGHTFEELPDPNWASSKTTPPSAIMMANDKFQKSGVADTPNQIVVCSSYVAILES